MVIILNVEIVSDSKVNTYCNKCQSCIHCLITHVSCLFRLLAHDEKEVTEVVVQQSKGGKWKSQTWTRCKLGYKH